MASQDPFSSSRTVVIDESSDLLIAQGNTVYAATPLFFPKVQILGSIEDVSEREIISYTVKEGDSISSVADKFGISKDTITWANDLSESKIRSGQELIILPVSGVFHVVSSGDTIDKIASKYEAESDQITEFNQIESIKEGDILVIPGGKIKKPVVSAQAPTKKTSGSSWLIAPASGYISQGYRWWHNAIDIANRCGSPIYAAASGTIQETGYDSIGGNYVKILHSNGVVTYYGHMSRIRVTPGESVLQGSQIGDIGNTGYTIGLTGCHVHFEVRGGSNPFASYPEGHRF